MSTPYEIIKNRPNSYDGLDVTLQGAEVPGTRKPGQTGHIRHAVWGLFDRNSSRALHTLPQLFEAGITRSRNRPFLGHRPLISTKPLKFANYYKWETYADIDERRRNLGSALDALFRQGAVGGGELPTVGIWALNRPEWQVVDLACQAYAKVSVSLYDTLGRDSVEYIINHSHITIAFTTANHIPTLLTLAPKCRMLKMIVSMDDLPETAHEVLNRWGAAHGVTVKTLSELEKLGKSQRIDLISAKPDDVVSICYTSGTTGNPKGVVIAHVNMVLGVMSGLFGSGEEMEGSMISYMPLAHIYERVIELSAIALGARIGYFTGDPLRLLEDVQTLRPRLFPSVPRVLNRVYQGAMLVANNEGIRASLLRHAIGVKLKRMQETGDIKHPFWDKLVFRKIKGVLGGNVDMITCGSAPISPDILDFLKIGLCCEVIEGWGMTETAATGTRTWSYDRTCTGTIGGPSPVAEMRLKDVPEMNYLSTDKPYPRGEIQIRGENCFKVYYKEPAKTAEAVDKDGWVSTGDIGALDEAGRFKIIDRVKNIMKLAQGEYVALEKIENTYSGCPIVAQIYVHGDSLRDHLVGVLYPEPQLFARWVGVPETDKKRLLQASKDPAILNRCLVELEKEANKAGLKGFERVKRVRLTLDEFTPENGLLTPTMKIKRRDAASIFQSEIGEMYGLAEVSKGAYKL